MKTIKFNPSEIEVKLAQAIKSSANDLCQKMDYTLENVTVDEKKDNPKVVIDLKDKDGDLHKVIVMLVQKPDEH